MSSRQDKATAERHTRTLRELVKRPENKICADCKRNDPRWASWNLGVFLCIRCSGIHRGMGTHISKVKSVDLDMWTPEQMASIQKWGNRRANLYWEAHLKPGHVPAEHKMESFIRSKYESRRWAMDGPPPTDPSVLESGEPQEPAPPVQTAPPTSTRSNHAPSSSISRHAGLTNKQPQPRNLLSANFMQPTVAQPSQPVAESQRPPAPTPAPVAQDDLFSLDFHTAPPTTSSNVAPQQQKKDVKQDILSLFSVPPSNPVPMQTASNLWTTQPQNPVAQPTSMVGNTGAGAWGASSGWAPAAPVPPTQPNVWGAPTNTNPPQNNIFNTNDIWGGASSTPTNATQDLFSTASTTSSTQKKDDVFGDIWGSFK